MTKNDNKNISGRLLVSEAILLDDNARDIFNKYELKIDILNELKKIGFKTMEEDLYEKGYNL